LIRFGVPSRPPPSGLAPGEQAVGHLEPGGQPVGARTVKENFVPPTDYKYPFMQEE
jgi:hypothetical protein